ncbi:DUF2613 domain-containing protein [Corynebacterium ulceribovis]|uniref:DUF2613 domain-containing protein n=1 Tax=Corynebacterium ulceribovis TaxID=487732 RepID=UPI0003807E83|nr:DUF2613 domain-containing protein [Corynebacterium ulceribovis]
MPYESDSEPRRTLGPALASALVGGLLGVGVVFAIAEIAKDSELPEAQAVSTEDAIMGGVEYGTR